MKLSELAKRLDFQLLLFAIIALLVFLLAMSFELLLSWLYAINKAYYSGYSLGKLIVTFLWLILTALIVALGYFLKLHKFFSKYEKALLVCFLIVVSFGFYLGAYQFISFGVQYKPRWMFASIIYEENYKNWEASKFYHNHFPKVTVYYAASLLGIDFGQKYDDGRPWFEALPDAELYAQLYLAIIILSIILLISYFFSISNKLSFFDFFILSSSALGLLIYIIDGGIAAAPISSVIFLFILFLVKRYCAFCRSHVSKAVIALALTFAVNYISVAIFDYYVPVSNFQLGLVFFMAFAYMTYFSALELLHLIGSKGKAKCCPFKLLLHRKELYIFLISAVLLYFSWVEIEKTLLPYAHGKLLVDYSKIYADIEPGAGLFIYGLPRELSTEALKQELENFGAVLELNKTGWVAFAKIMPNGNVTDKQVAEHLRQKFNPSTYLYADETALRPFYESIYIYWEKPTDSRQYIGNKFADMEVLQRFEYGDRSIIVVKAYAGPTWQLLSVLTEIKEKGHKGKVIVAK
ncbi:MAG: hypothetical protein QXM75_04505 [Candidatus Diapherotrites archaeon]